MLLHMHINNIALIDDINIDFEDGLNILTGETGAGKSIIIGSLGIGLGGKFQKELLRDDNKEGIVELLFSIDDDKLSKKLSELDIDVSDGELLVSRKLSANGRTVNKINDSTVTTAKLKEVTASLIDLHAQHEQQTLLKASKHLAILDSFGGKALAAKKEKVTEIYHEYQDILHKIEEGTMDDSEKNKKMDFLAYEINEIQVANLKTGEDEALEAQYKKAVNSREILTLANEAYEMTGYGSNSSYSASDMVGRALACIKKTAELDSDASGLYDILTDVDSLINDFNSEINDYMKDMEFDEESFNEIEERLDLINSLKSKYGNSIEQIMESLKGFEEEYNKLTEYEQYISELNIRLKEVEKQLEKATQELSDLRKKEAKKLCKLIKEALEELNFMTVSFDMEFNKLDTYSANGYDEAYFIISTNIGEPMRPLYDVASGGELSRVMLAMKSCLANEDDTPTLIFDEIDVGISGRTAQRVAEKMSIIAKHHQVICITHLPQIAAMADYHYCIDKKAVNNKTITSIVKLDCTEQINEIARLLGGAEITETTLASAKDMKAMADKVKNSL